MKKYVFFSTCDLHDMGGVPYYYAGKAKYLESEGWQVMIFHPGSKEQTCAIAFLNKYVSDGSLKWPSGDWQSYPWYRHRYIKQLAEKIADNIHNEEIIIETHDYWTSPWVELLAAKLNAKHIIKELNELNENDVKMYQKYLDFYLFKLRRREHFCGHMSLAVIYRGIDGISEENVIPFLLNEDPVQDVENLTISSITHTDWNIGYIGRANKGYLPNIIDGVCGFAKNHTDHEIQFVVIGVFDAQRDYYNEKACGINNLKLVELGDLSPLPRCYFEKVDVVIAGAGSARCTTYEGKLALVADASNFLCNGLLGYDTNNAIYSEATQMSFLEGLERALVQKTYEGMQYRYPPQITVEACCKQNLEAIESSDQTKEYFSEKKLCSDRSAVIDTGKRLAVKLLRRINSKAWRKEKTI